MIAASLCCVIIPVKELDCMQSLSLESRSRERDLKTRNAVNNY